jgi:hypothetical protein|tara:strand:+ start:197 stop:553 length:357 start_codon:yes stop_codon:yes gene_type:complete
MIEKPLSNITNEPADNVDEAIMSFMPVIADKMQEILMSPEYKKYLSVTYKERIPCPVELIIFETMIQVIEEGYKDFEKASGREMPEQIKPRMNIKRYLENPEISFSNRWRLYTKEDLN